MSDALKFVGEAADSPGDTPEERATQPYRLYVLALAEKGSPKEAPPRVTGEAGWVLEAPLGVEEFIDYESQLNDFAPRYPQVILCLYDLAHFGGGMIVDVLKTHKKLLLGGLVLENPHYLTPDEFRATRS